jgi:hypothetical protein
MGIEASQSNAAVLSLTAGLVWWSIGLAALARATMHSNSESFWFESWRTVLVACK